MTHRRKIAGILLLAGAYSLSAQTRPTPSGQQQNSIGMEFVKIQPGEFVMGCSENDNRCNPDEKPAHSVRITNAFEIGKYEVTQAQWRAVMGTDPSAMKGDDRPVETIAKTEVEDFISRLNARNDGFRYRLPTEAEWEYAARAGAKNANTGPLNDVAWHAGNSEDESHPVGKKKPNAWGLHDMEGNVREFVSDAYAANYYANSALENPTGPATGQAGAPDARGAGPTRGGPPPGTPGGRGPRGGPDGGPRGGRGFNQLPVMRGGAWDNLESFVRLSARYSYYGSTLRVSDVGFRVVRVPIAQ